METDAPPVPRVPAQRQATQRLTGCSSASQQRKCGSPTRAPSGGSLSQSGSRAKSAVEEEWSQAAPRCQAPSAAEIGASANKSSDLEEGEVPATPPPGHDEDDSDECQLKTTILEQQVTSLRKTNAKLLLRLKDHDKRHTKKYAALLEENLSLRKRLKELSKMEKSRVEEIEELTEESRRLATRLEKSKTKRKEATRDLNDKVDKLTAKVEFQKQNLTGLKSKLWKFTHSDSSPTFTVNERKEPESSSSVEGCSSESYRKLRTRIQNQTEQLAHLNAVLTRERHVAESLVFQLKVLGHQPKTQSCVMTETGPLPASFKHQAHSTWVPPDMTPMKSGDDPNLNVKFQEGSFESSILKVVTNAFPLARRVMKNYEELSACLPTLTPPVMAAIAAMPPATRSLCLGQMKAMPGQQLTSADKEKDLDLPLEKQDSHAMMVRFLSSVLPCPPHGAENGSGQTQPGISASPEAAFGTGPSLALKAEQCTAGNEEPSSRTLPPARAYGPEMPVSVVEGARSQESGFGEETARIKVEVPSLPPPSMAETEPATSKAPCSNAAESAASDSPAGSSAAHHPESQSVQPTLGVSEGSRAPHLGSGSHSEACCVPAAVAYPLPLHEGHKQHIDSVHPGFHAAGAAVPCFSGCIPGSRKRLSQDEVCDLERSARIASEIQIMKKRIVKHLQLDRK